MSFLNGFKIGFIEFGINVTILVNCLLLTPVYFFGVGITFLVSRITGKHFLDLKKQKKSYWKELNLNKKPTEEYYRQF